jgi:hypothetical protein
MAPRRSARLAALAASKHPNENICVTYYPDGSRRVVFIQNHIREYPYPEPEKRDEMSSADVIWVIVTWFLLICCIYSLVSSSR